MFTGKDLSAIDRRYFKVIQATGFSVTIKSKNTGHCWHILIHEYPHCSGCTIMHTHGSPAGWHEHGRGRNLTECIRQIKSHDRYQLAKNAEKRRTTNRAGTAPTVIQ